MDDIELLKNELYQALEKGASQDALNISHELDKLIVMILRDQLSNR